MKTGIRIHPVFDAFFNSFYLPGLRANFGRRHVYTLSGFPRHTVRLSGHNHFAVIVDSKPELKFYIDASDASSVASEWLEWCDVYAKINLDDGEVPPDSRHKLLPIGPSFGIRLWCLPKALCLATSRYLRFRNLIQDPPREHFANYYRQWRHRLPAEAYAPGESRNDYIFFAGRLWKLEPETNTFRANFIRAGSSLKQVQFEGGLAPRAKNDVPGFDDLTMARHVPFPEYLQKLKTSAVAFNTPAVFGCHGWKLGEFLALGKAIVSTPLTHALPSPLEHGTHIHYVDGSVESIRQAVEFICQDDAYRKKLESNAREYYLTYLQPSRVISRILSHAENLRE